MKTDEFGSFLVGRAGKIELEDSLIIPGDTPHFARNESDEIAILLDVFSPVREGIM